MSAIDQVRRIERLSSVPAKYRINWLPLAERLAVQVKSEVERLRIFAELQSGFVAEHCRETANHIEIELQLALDRFGVV